MYKILHAPAFQTNENTISNKRTACVVRKTAGNDG